MITTCASVLLVLPSIGKSGRFGQTRHRSFYFVAMAINSKWRSILQKASKIGLTFFFDEPVLGPSRAISQLYWLAGWLVSA
jgi:hypothetical protein